MATRNQEVTWDVMNAAADTDPAMWGKNVGPARIPRTATGVANYLRSHGLKGSEFDTGNLRHPGTAVRSQAAPHIHLLRPSVGEHRRGRKTSPL